MRAIQISRQGGPEVLELVEIDRPVPGEGQLLIKVESAALNYSDVMRRSGAPYPFPTPLPFVLGGEVAGVVAELGPGVGGPPVGTPVFALAGLDGSGGYAEFALANAPSVIPIPPGLSSDQAAGVVIAGTTATLLLTATANLQPGQSVLIPAAAGGVGSYAVQIAKLLGAGTVIGTGSTPEKREIALALGADYAIAPDAGFDTVVRELTNGAGVDLALEAAGGQTLNDTVRSLAPFGAAVVYGMASGRPGTIDEDSWRELLYAPALNQSMLTFNLGVWFGLQPERAVKAISQIVGWIASGQVNAPNVTTVALEDAATAHELLQSRRSVGKLVLRP